MADLFALVNAAIQNFLALLLALKGLLHRALVSLFRLSTAA
jgi:hypothetical protein